LGGEGAFGCGDVGDFREACGIEAGQRTAEAARVPFSAAVTPCRN
jgi:hypothetical protein